MNRAAVIAGSLALLYAPLGLLYAPLGLAQPATQIKTFHAFTPEDDLNPNFVVVQRYTGQCTAPSLANPNRSDAWQCQANNMTIDPCYAEGSSLACIVSPFTHKAAILELSTPLEPRKNQPIASQTATPWGLELANGQQCTFVTGAPIAINKIRVSYSCSSYNFSVLGDINRSTPLWQVLLYDFDAKVTKQVAVTAAWF